MTKYSIRNIVIIAVTLTAASFAGWLYVCAMYQSSQSKEEIAKARLRRIVDISEEFLSDNPKRKDAVCSNIQSVFIPKQWRKYATDPWKKPVVVFCKDYEVCVRSSGPNKYHEGGGADDIVVCRIIGDH